MTGLQIQLFSNQDLQYRTFQQKLIPNIDPETIIGVRTPVLRKMAVATENADVFLKSLPHQYFEENQLHAFLLEQEKNFNLVISQLEIFLPYVDNWATCDQIRPKCFKRHREDLLNHIRCWLTSDHVYTVRFGIGMLMTHFLDEDFDPQYLNWVADVKSEEYYVRMMQAWYFATALAKQYDSSISYITNFRLEPWIHNKSIQKATESFRITQEQKQYLKIFRIK